jgi:hypothetical protein
MHFYQAMDLEFDSLQQEAYDVAFLASGYEERCTNVPRRLHVENVRRAVVLGFQELSIDQQREENDAFFASKWSSQPVVQRASEETAVISALAESCRSGVENLRILIDYSSMSRIWYAAILNWARFACQSKVLSLDFVYSVGEHIDIIPPMVINDIVSVPGLEGRVERKGRSVAVFGLGFDGLATLCVLDRLEPDTVYAYYASPAAFADYPDRVREANTDLFAHEAMNVLALPLHSVERTYRSLIELAIQHRGEARIVFVPMGPKPHVLAAMLASIRLEEIACLRVSSTRQRSETVRATGQIVCTRVEFREGKSGLSRTKLADSRR